jgi:hypothetical protein
MGFEFGKQFKNLMSHLRIHVLDEDEKEYNHE